MAASIVFDDGGNTKGRSSSQLEEIWISDFKETIRASLLRTMGLGLHTFSRATSTVSSYSQALTVLSACASVCGTAG